ncbi:CLUMA_CG006988, isoform A [Clunio marinus]|uniref:CLUMA_CG006988, isoform A n=1 Tax=Clunio marinus TaxID=568069 RepID=A0A1J1I1I6_9DIPT|nr:CLUMA_CG006988, isoform A [Clunio marinus]
MLNKKVLIIVGIAILVKLKLLNLNILGVEGQCGVCNTTIHYACLSKTQFARCNDTFWDLTTVDECPKHSVCNLSLPLKHQKTPCFDSHTHHGEIVKESCKNEPLMFKLPKLKPEDEPAVGQCGVCNTTIHYACLSKTQFARCNDTFWDLTTVDECPKHSVCNLSLPLKHRDKPCFDSHTHHGKIVMESCKNEPLMFKLPKLKPEDEPAVGQCGVCNTTIHYACLSKPQFARCNDTFWDLTTVDECPKHSVCNLSLPLKHQETPCFDSHTHHGEIVMETCKNELLMFKLPTMKPEDQPFDPTTFCSDRSVGLFPHPTNLDCSYYVRCFVENSINMGAVLMCPGSSRFNPYKRLCDISEKCQT